MHAFIYNTDECVYTCIHVVVSMCVYSYMSIWMHLYLTVCAVIPECACSCI